MLVRTVMDAELELRLAAQADDVISAAAKSAGLAEHVGRACSLENDQTMSLALRRVQRAGFALNSGTVSTARLTAHSGKSVGKPF
jgi:hypothetical protein